MIEYDFGVLLGAVDVVHARTKLVGPRRPGNSFSGHSPMGAEQLFPWDKALSTSDAIEDVERIEADRSRWSRF